MTLAVAVYVIAAELFLWTRLASVVIAARLRSAGMGDAGTCLWRGVLKDSR